jgi:hypothetical protein
MITKSVEHPIAPSPRTLRTEVQAAAALPADVSGLEGVIHSLLLSALEKIVDRMYQAPLRSDDQSRRPFAIAETDSTIESSIRSPAEPRETMLRVGSLELDLINRTVKRGARADRFAVKRVPSTQIYDATRWPIGDARKTLPGRVALQIRS